MPNDNNALMILKFPIATDNSVTEIHLKINFWSVNQYENTKSPSCFFPRTTHWPCTFSSPGGIKGSLILEYLWTWLWTTEWLTSSGCRTRISKMTRNHLSMGWQWKTEWFDSIQMGQSFMAYGMLGVLISCMSVLGEVQLEAMPLSYPFFLVSQCHVWVTTYSI